MSHRKSGLRPIVLASLFAFCSAPAFAERPMAVDDAGTLERGGAKLEFGWSRDDAVRGYEGAAGFGPIDNVEVEVGFGRAKDRDADPDAKIHAVGAAIKWVPLQSETGLSAGLKYEYGRERVSGEDSTRVDALAGLATWAFEQGVLSRNRRKFRQPINVACPSPGRWGRPNSRVTSRHFDHGNASRMSRPDCSGLDGAD